MREEETGRRADTPVWTAQGGTRTRTPLTGNSILSAVRIPVSPPGLGSDALPFHNVVYPQSPGQQLVPSKERHATTRMAHRPDSPDRLGPCPGRGVAPPLGRRD